jgi:integrase
MVEMFIKKYGITAPDLAGLRKLADTMEERRIENSTRRFYINCFSSWAESTGRPVDIKQVFTRRPPLKDNMITIIPNERIAMIPKVCTNARDLAYMELSLFTGIRVGEATRLLMADVDTENQVLHISNFGMITTKNKKERDVPIPDECIPYLEEWLAVRTDYLVRHKINLPPDQDYYFITNKCKQMTPQLFRVMMWNLKSKLGYKKGERFSPHLFRHTCNSRALASGMTIDDAVENFGWSDARIATRYTHSGIEKRKANMKKFSYKDGDDDDPAPAPIIKK